MFTESQKSYKQLNVPLFVGIILHILVFSSHIVHIFVQLHIACNSIDEIHGNIANYT